MAKLVFLGSPEAAVPSLRALQQDGHTVSLVVSQPDKRRGRGVSLSPSPVKRAATEMGLSVEDHLDAVLSSGAELGVVVAFGKLVPRRVLDVVPMINGHFSLLPRWRGAAPVERAILAGDAKTGVCVMRLDEGMDTGPVISRRELDIDNSGREHASSLTRRLADLSAQMLSDALKDGVAGLGPGDPQRGEPTYAPKVEADELRLDFSSPAAALERVVRLDRAWTTFRGERLRVLDARACTDPMGEKRPGALRGTLVGTGNGSLELIEVQPAGRRPVAAGDWVRGARAVPGDMLGD